MRSTASFRVRRRTRTSSAAGKAAQPRRTPLFDRHRALGGRIVDFAGWEMPQQYSSIQEEHLAVRRSAGLFDVSHMGRISIRGADALEFVQRLVTNDLTRIAPGQAQYNLLCNESGGILDDLVVYRAQDSLLLVVNASNRERDLDWIRQHADSGLEIEDRTFELSLLAFQGPAAERQLPAASVERIGYFGFETVSVAGVDAVVSRTGYTGEDGFEIMVEAERVGRVWDAILERGQKAGVKPCGLGARDACRLEAALRLYGSDMNEETNPYEAGLGWVVKLQKGDFIGRQALEEVKRAGPKREIAGLRSLDRSIPRHDSQVLVDGRVVGKITSGTYSFFLGQAIALASVQAGTAPVGARVEVEGRAGKAAAEVVSLPFYRGSVHSPGPAVKAQKAI